MVILLLNSSHLLMTELFVKVCTIHCTV